MLACHFIQNDIIFDQSEIEIKALLQLIFFENQIITFVAEVKQFLGNCFFKECVGCFVFFIYCVLWEANRKQVEKERESGMTCIKSPLPDSKWRCCNYIIGALNSLFLLWCAFILNTHSTAVVLMSQTRAVLVREFNLLFTWSFHTLSSCGGSHFLHYRIQCIYCPFFPPLEDVAQRHMYHERYMDIVNQNGASQRENCMNSKAREEKLHTDKTEIYWAVSN